MAVKLTAVNLTASPIALPDIGKTVPASGTVLLTSDLSLSEIRDSIDLQNAIIADQVVLSDDLVTLSKEQSLAGLTSEMSSGVQVTDDDTSPSTLDDKISVGAVGLQKTIVNPGADETLQLSVDTSVFPVTITPDQANAIGSSTSLARADHVHNLPAATPVSIGAGGANAEGTAASFARSDHVHQISDPSIEVAATGTVSTTSAAFINVPSMSITPGPGTYLAFFSSWGTHTANSAELVVGLALAGADILASERRAGNTTSTDNSSMVVATQAKIVVGVGQAVTARYRVDGSGSATLNQRSLILIKVA